MYKLKLGLLAIILIVAFGCDQDNSLVGTEDNDMEINAGAATETGLVADLETPEELAAGLEGNTLGKYGFGGAVFTMTNAAGGNEIVAFARDGSGALSQAGSYATGGLGTGAGLGNQGGLVITEGRRFLFVCNAGSNDISMFDVHGTHLELLNTANSGGQTPISVTVFKNTLYVLNAGSGDITGFRVNRKGDFKQIVQLPLSGGGTAPAQIGFSPDGNTLVVTEKGTNLILTYHLNRYGRASGPKINESSGLTPFGFAFDKRGHLVVSEAFGAADNASAVSSYQVRNHGGVRVISASVASNQTAACWIAITGNGKYAYCTNAGTGNLSGYRIDKRGRLSLLNDSGITAETGAGTAPIDMAFSRNSRYLYVLNSGTMSITIFEVGYDGSLENAGSISGLPSGVNGLAAM